MSAPDTQPAGAPPALPDPLRVAELLVYLDGQVEWYTGEDERYIADCFARHAATVRALVEAAGAADRRRAGEP